MAMINCPECRKRLSDTEPFCPLCGHWFVPVEERSKYPNPTSQYEKSTPPTPVPFDWDLEKAALYQLILPLAEDWSKLKDVRLQMKRAMHKYVCISLVGRDAVWASLDKLFKQEISSLEYARERNNTAMSQAIKNYNTIANSSAYNGLGFSVITDSAGIAAYAALDAFEGTKHDLAKQKAACAAFLTAMEGTVSVNRNVGQLKAAIDNAVEELAWLEECRDTLAEYKSFYADPAKNDPGIEINSVNLFQLLKETFSHNDFVKDYRCISLYQSMPAKKWNAFHTTLKQLEQDGYVRILGHRTCQVYLASTGKFEKAALMQSAANAYWFEHAEEKASLEQELVQIQLRMAEQRISLESLEKERAQLIAAQKNRLPIEIKLDQQIQLIKDLEQKRANCSIFQGREKKAITAQLDTFERPTAETLKKDAFAARKAYNTEVNNKMSQIANAEKELRKGLQQAQLRVEQITQRLAQPS